jgi:hypothetical protein
MVALSKKTCRWSKNLNCPGGYCQSIKPPKKFKIMLSQKENLSILGASPKADSMVLTSNKEIRHTQNVSMGLPTL